MTSSAPMNERVNVLTLKWGTLYPADYVNRIYRSVARNLSRPFRFVCVTDDPSGLLPEVEPVAFPPRPEWFPPDAHYSAWPGIFVKLLVFEPGFAGLEGPTLFLDIDQIVVGGLDRFFDYRPGEFCIIRNWIELRKRIFRKAPFCGNSSCFRFDAGERSRYIYDTFRREVAVALDGRTFPTEQAYMTHAVGRDRVNFWPPDFVVSFKRGCERPWPLNHFLAPRPPAPGSGILCFHGRPRPEEAVAGYRGRHLNTWTLPCPWLRKLWEQR